MCNFSLVWSFLLTDSNWGSVEKLSLIKKCFCEIFIQFFIGVLWGLIPLGKVWNIFERYVIIPRKHWRSLLVGVGMFLLLLPSSGVVSAPALLGHAQNKLFSVFLNCHSYLALTLGDGLFIEVRLTSLIILLLIFSSNEDVIYYDFNTCYHKSGNFQW